MFPAGLSATVDNQAMVQRSKVLGPDCMASISPGRDGGGGGGGEGELNIIYRLHGEAQLRLSF